MINASETPLVPVRTSHSLLLNYEEWLRDRNLSKHTKRNYLSQIRQFIAFASQFDMASQQPFHDPDRLDLLVRNYSIYLRDSVNARLSTINKSLAAIDHFYRFLGFGCTSVKRAKLNYRAPRILTTEETDKLLHVLDGQISKKDRAVVLLFLYTGIRLGECVALNVDDVYVAVDSCKILVNSQRSGASREVPLQEPAREALLAWQNLRALAQPRDRALFFNAQRTRISTAGLDLIVRKIGIRAGLVLSAQVLRDTCLTALAQKSRDTFLVTQISGCKRLDSTRKYFELASEQLTSVSRNDLGIHP
jgi:site-specific recombinase XerC